MKALIQRVKKASVTVDGKLCSQIGHGLLVLLGVVKGDEKLNADKLAEKLVHLRIFEDENGKMNKSLLDEKGEMLIVSQFTLCGDCKRGLVQVLTNRLPQQLQITCMNILFPKLKSIMYRFKPVYLVL